MKPDSGQKNTAQRVEGQTWHAPAGTPDQRTEWTYIFGAICTAKAKGAGLAHALVRTTPSLASHTHRARVAAFDAGAHAL